MQYLFIPQQQFLADQNELMDGHSIGRMITQFFCMWLLRNYKALKLKLGLQLQFSMKMMPGASNKLGD